MTRIEKRKAKRWIKCGCCQEQIRTDEPYFQVVGDNDNDIRGERYCPSCEGYAYENNDIDEHDSIDGERRLRQMENFAAYRAAGCSQAYFDDQQEGFVE